MVWKQATDACAGTAAKYGAPDVKKVSQLFSDTDITDIVTIHESVAWQYQSHPCTGASIRISNPAQTFNYIITSSAIVANRNLTLPLLTGNDTIATLAVAQTFNTAAKTFNDTILKVRNPADTFSYTIRSGAIAADRDITLPVLTGTSTLTFSDFANAWGTQNQNIAATGKWQEAGISISPIGLQEEWIPANVMWARTTAGAGGLTKVETATNRVNYQVWEFDTTTQEFIQFSWVPPRNFNNGTVKFTFYWTNAAGASTQTVDWGVAGVAISNDDPLEVAFGTQIVTTDTWLAQNDVHISPQSTAVTIAGTPVDADFIQFQIARNVVTDNMAGDARLLGVVLEYTKDAAVTA